MILYDNMFGVETIFESSLNAPNLMITQLSNCKIKMVAYVNDNFIKIVFVFAAQIRRIISNLKLLSYSMSIRPNTFLSSNPSKSQSINFCSDAQVTR